MLSRPAARNLPVAPQQVSAPVCEICGQSAVCDIDAPTVAGPMSLAVVWGTSPQARHAAPTRLCFDCLALLLDDENSE
jgi:hypothetical protein